MRSIIISLLCVVAALVTIAAFGHWEWQEGKHPPVTPRLNDNGDGTVTDNMTGLIWLKDAKCFGSLTWYEAMRAAASLTDGQCGLTDGSATGDWRLPKRAELLTLVGELYKYLTLRNTMGTDQWREGHPFSGVQLGPYWSATTCESYPTTAWLVLSLYHGRIDYESKTHPHYVWLVRDGQ